MLTVEVYIRFADCEANVESGISHLQSILDNGGSNPIDVQRSQGHDLCDFHTNLSIRIKERSDDRSAVLFIDLPQCLCGGSTGVATFLGEVFYCSAFSFIEEMQINDLLIRDTVKAHETFKGPAFGVSGLRNNLFPYTKGPLVGLILKPRTRINLKSQLSFVKKALETKMLDYIIDDELVISPECLSFRDKVSTYKLLIDELSTRLGKQIVYWVNIAGSIDVADRIVEYCMKKNINTFSINAVSMGFSAAEYIINKYRGQAYFIVSNIGRGIMTRPSDFSLTETFLAKLSRMIGADAVYTGPISNEFPYSGSLLKKEKEALQEPFGNCQKSFVVCSGNITDSRDARENIQTLGENTMIQIGTALYTNQDINSKLRSFRFIVENALNDNLMEELGKAFNDNNNGGKNNMTTHDLERRADTLTRQLNNHLTLLIKLDDALLRETVNPVLHDNYELQKVECEKTILSEAYLLADLSERLTNIDVSIYFTDQVIQICEKYSSSLSVEEKDDIMRAINQGIASLEQEVSPENKDLLASTLANKNSLELTIPIIPTILSYKTSISMDASLNLKKGIKKLLEKIKGHTK